MPRPILLAIILVLVAFSGCTNTKPDADGLDSSAPTSTSSASTVTTPAISNVTAPIVPLQLVLDNCTGWIIFQNRPTGTGSNQRPNEWGPAPAENLVYGMGVQAYACNRISLGQFERGPVHLLIDLHGDANFPPACSKDLLGLTFLKLVTMAWIDDAEIAAFLTQTYGMPVGVLESMEETSQDLGEDHVRTWSWTADSQPSSVTIPDSQNDPDNQVYDRFFWPNGAGLVELDLTADRDAPPGELVAHGTLGPHHPVAKETQGAFVGHGEYYPKMNAQGTFTLYSDRFCEKPLP